MTSPTPWADARAKIEAAALVPPDRVYWPNEPFVLPEPPAVWLAVESEGDVMAPIELGGRTWQEEGTFYVHVMAPAGQGTAEARVLAEAVMGLFRGLGPASMTYLGGAIGRGGPSDDGAWWRLSASVDFKFQTVAAA